MLVSSQNMTSRIKLPEITTPSIEPVKARKNR